MVSKGNRTNILPNLLSFLYSSVSTRSGKSGKVREYVRGSGKSGKLEIRPTKFMLLMFFNV